MKEKGGEEFKEVLALGNINLLVIRLQSHKFKPCKSSKLYALIKFLLTFLPWVDMATDGICIHNWRRLCEAGRLECFFWPLGFFFARLV